MEIGPGTTLDPRHSFVDGRPVTSGPGAHTKNVHPGNNRTICEFAFAGSEIIERAVAAARAGYLTWSSTPAVERGRVLLRASQILRERNDELAKLETLDTGKPISETSTVDIATGADVVEFYGGVAASISGETMDFPPDGFVRLRREPLGVCVGLGAWNYPMQIAMWKSSLALACGNSMVFKPSELTPITATVLAEIYIEAGLPPGVFNVVLGGRAVGQQLVQHPGVAKVSLTGGVETGKAIMTMPATTLKRVTLELGGKSPLIVFADADLESARNAVITHNFYSTGQVCSNGSRVFVERSIYEDFVASLAERTAELVIGDPFDPNTNIGPLISAEHRRKVLGYMDAAMATSARHVIGGGIPNDSGLEEGNYIEPAVFADATDDMAFVAEEVFGPLMAVLAFDSEDEVITRANATHFGLAGGVFTSDFARANRVAHSLEAGTVWINDYNVLPASVPFGGHKQSGLGLENGRHSIEEYTQLKAVYANLGSVPRTM